MTTRGMAGISKPKQKLNLHVSTTISPLPRNPTEALSDSNWKHAMTDEFDALIDNKMWELVPRRHDMNIIRSMWIFRHKKKSDGSCERYKASLVCDGRSQQVGVDCGDTFSPVVKPSIIRTLVHQLDVKNAFLHDNFKETVYMHQPMGFRNIQYLITRVSSKSPSTASNKPPMLGTNGSQTMSPPWVSLIENDQDQEMNESVLQSTDPDHQSEDLLKTLRSYSKNHQRSLGGRGTEKYEKGRENVKNAQSQHSSNLAFASF
ncbi:hypothetical protein OSB04_un001485 [Centaurea solstitialis]|uniref:Reverse transcriptase Ty1/copia-type domain-containing protein n=1 Tax=Centaurea solstitialis TaxID=347529 RepID=A0AA38SNM3_9ASTR|nr:hypothetical protein OSB04_un001485 [Centaurea solstitialis]